LFTHILRILSVHSPESVNELDRRYPLASSPWYFTDQPPAHLCDPRFRLITSFGKDKIRRFSNNASQMKKLAAHNFEDLLQVAWIQFLYNGDGCLTTRQCTLPVLDGLLPAPHEAAILDLVFVMGCWHAYAKLRVHTEQTLASFECLTADLGTLLRHFSTVTCAAFTTTELPKERAARIRRVANAPGSTTPGGGPKAKGFSLSTYKLHALGDYPQTIRERGTTDNYTSQRVWNEWYSTSAQPC
jgi:hypothetical protein